MKSTPRVVSDAKHNRPVIVYYFILVISKDNSYQSPIISLIDDEVPQDRFNPCSATPILTLVLMSCLFLFFIRSQLELLTQLPAKQDEK